jgi:serine/threonine protein phosphatase PrpC
MNSRIKENDDHPSSKTTLSRGGLNSFLTLDDIKKTSVLQEVTGSFKKLFRRIAFGKVKDIQFKIASLSDQGQRDYQQDAIIVEELGEGLAFAALSDGMGGHAAGDIAATIAVDTIRAKLLSEISDADNLEKLQKLFVDCVDAANKAISDHTEKDPETEGMGTTLVVAFVRDHKLYWLSIGDSPLYLWRNKKFYQLNQDHSMAPALDMMASKGLMTAEEARVHPNRNNLTSALNHQKPEMIDICETPLDLVPGDLILISSDGLQTMQDTEIAKTLNSSVDRDPQYICAALLGAVIDLADPDQDNIGVVAMKVEAITAFDIAQKERDAIEQHRMKEISALEDAALDEIARQHKQRGETDDKTK